MRKIFLSLIAVCFLFTSKAQITKGNWLVGGNGTISKQQEKLFGTDIKSTNIQLNPDLAYFIIDKFSVGLSPSFGYVDLKAPTYQNKTTSWGVGPFVRYYFLPTENRINLFGGTSYQYLSYSNGGNEHTFLFSGGPAIFFNTSVALEITANYKIFQIHNTNTSSKTFFIAIGFQIHLEKD